MRCDSKRGKRTKHVLINVAFVGKLSTELRERNARPGVGQHDAILLLAEKGREGLLDDGGTVLGQVLAETHCLHAERRERNLARVEDGLGEQEQH